MYVQRSIEKTLRDYLSAFPIVGLTGPRQSGKSTLLQHTLGETYRYLSFDDWQLVKFFQDDPELFMQTYNRHVIFDEVQKVPEFFNYLKLIVDQNRDDYGRFVVTGSSQFLFLNQVSESLAGRIGLLRLLPFEFNEISAKLTQASQYKGSYPELVCRNYAMDQAWYASYIDTYLSKDVKLLHNVGNIRDFGRLIQLLAARVSQLINYSEYANELGVSVPTITRWMSILEASSIIFLLPPYYQNLGKRLVKMSKLYFIDTGLVSFLTGITEQALYQKGPLAGALFENYFISEVVKHQCNTHSFSKLYFWRTHTGEEVDLIIDHKTHQEWIEIKRSVTFKPDMIRTLKAQVKKPNTGTLIYNGKHLELGESLQCYPINEYLSHHLSQ